MKNVKFKTCKNIVKRFKGKKILVVGDLLLDQYIWGDVSRISPEAPVPVVWTKKEDYIPGGACNVANNLAALDAKVFLAGVVGDDLRGALLKEKLIASNIAVGGIITDKTRPTSQKTRVIAQNQQVVRIDRESIDTLKGKGLKALKEYVRSIIPEIDAVIVEDYGKGVITAEMLKAIVPVAKKHKKLIAVDPKEDHFAYYRGVSVITPNHHEAEKAIGMRLEGIDRIKKAGDRLLSKLKTESILITLGERGMLLFEKGRKPYHIPTLAQEVFDVSGAGDTVIAVYVLSASSGGSARNAAYIANCAAGIVVGKVGAAVITNGELLTKLKAETIN